MPRHKSKFGLPVQPVRTQTTETAKAPAAGAATALAQTPAPAAGAAAAPAQTLEPPRTGARIQNPFEFASGDKMGIVLNRTKVEESQRALGEMSATVSQTLSKTTLTEKIALGLVVAELVRNFLIKRRWEQFIQFSDVEFYESAFRTLEQTPGGFELFKFVLFCTYRQNEPLIRRFTKLIVDALDSPTNIPREVLNGLDTVIHNYLHDSSFATAVQSATNGTITGRSERILMTTTNETIDSLVASVIASPIWYNGSYVDAIDIYQEKTGVNIRELYNSDNLKVLQDFMTTIHSRSAWTGVSNWVIFVLLASALWSLYAFIKSKGSKGKITTASFGRRRTKKDKKRSQRK
jgi:hypothetical protein